VTLRTDNVGAAEVLSATAAPTIMIGMLIMIADPGAAAGAEHADDDDHQRGHRHVDAPKRRRRSAA
jgi:hypothetical protein